MTPSHEGKETVPQCQIYFRRGLISYRHAPIIIAADEVQRSVSGMRTTLNLKPGKKGTRRLLAEYGDRLVRVRYRYDEQRKKRIKTVELIVDETDWQPGARIKPDALVGIRVRWGEADVASRVRQAGGIWDRSKRLWFLRYDGAIELGVDDRIEEGI